jgi:hypothetical protein
MRVDTHIRLVSPLARSVSSRSGQSRRMSAIESVVNVIVGLTVSMSLTRWLTGAEWTQAAHWSVWFTVASLVRSYGLRRAFSRFDRS